VVERCTGGKGEPVLLATGRARGVGIDPAAASAVVHYGRWGNPMLGAPTGNQVRPVGQRHAVGTVKLVAVDTLQEHISSLLESKGSLARKMEAPTPEPLQRLTVGELGGAAGDSPGTGRHGGKTPPRPLAAVTPGLPAPWLSLTDAGRLARRLDGAGNGC